MTQRPSAPFSARFAAFALSAFVTLAMLGSVDFLATSQPPASLVAQISHSLPHAVRHA
jgi:hypothetical protein